MWVCDVLDWAMVKVLENGKDDTDGNALYVRKQRRQHRLTQSIETKRFFGSGPAPWVLLQCDSRIPTAAYSKRPSVLM